MSGWFVVVMDVLQTGETGKFPAKDGLRERTKVDLTKKGRDSGLGYCRRGENFVNVDDGG